jgi:hypothetical protein
MTPNWKNWYSYAHVKNWNIVHKMDNCQNYDMDWSSMNMVHVGENSKGSWLDLAPYHYEKLKNYQTENSCFTLTI